jgi:hypothetical protein
MIDYVYLGSVPCDESAPQAGFDSNLLCWEVACTYKRQLLELAKANGFEVRILVKTEIHELENYYECVAKFDCENERLANEAYALEAMCPSHWTEASKTAIAELRLNPLHNESPYFRY